MQQRYRHARVARWGIGIALFTIACFTLRLNISPSLPYGLYFLSPLSATPATNTLVTLPVPSSLRFLQTIPLLKPIAALPGDSACVNNDRLTIGGIDYGQVYHESHGKLIAAQEGCIVVPEGHVFVASQAPRSLDSRYFGPVPLATLTAQATPLITWR